MQQSSVPNEINIWASNEPYLRDSGIKEIPAWVNELNKISNIVKFHITLNTGPFRKLLPALRAANENDIIVTADDDIIYGPKWLKELICEHNKNRDHIIAARVRSIEYNGFKKKTSYVHWPLIKSKVVLTTDFIVTHGGGAVFQRRLIDEKLLFNDDFLNVSPTADDLWFSMLIKQSKTPVTVCPKALNELYFIDHNDGLDNHNLINTKSLTKKIYKRLVLYPLGWLGFSVCGNDYAFKNIEKYISQKAPKG